MSKRQAENQIPAASDDAPDMVEVSVTGHARTSNHWKKQRYNNNRGDNKAGDDAVTLTVAGQAIPNLNAAPLTIEAGLDATTPLRQVAYSKQNGNKKRDLWKTFTSMTKEIEKNYRITNTQLKRSYLDGSMKNFTQYQFDQPLRTEYGVACITGPVMHSPIDHSYRNKNEFTISYGLGDNSEQIEVGFLCGRFADGESRVGSPEGSLSCPPAVVEITRAAKDFLNTHPVAKKYKPWTKMDNKGLFRLLTVRDCPITRQLMICLQLNPISFTPEFDHLTQGNPTIEGYSEFTPEEKSAANQKHIAEREAKELENLQTVASDEIAEAFRDFCIENFYGGSIWRQGAVNPHTKATFVPPHDSYDLTSPDSPDLEMAKEPSFSTNNQYVKKGLYKPLPSDDSAEGAVSAKGRAFTHKFNYSLASVIVQSHSGVSNSANMQALQNCLFGSHYIYAQLSELFFRVSINSFLQVNIKAATSLYNIARTWAMTTPHDFNMSVEDANAKYLDAFTAIHKRFDQTIFDQGIRKTSITPIKDSGYDPNDLMVPPPPDLPEADKPTVLFDVCCGTGTIGLLNSSSAKEVVGIDIVQSAIDDAKANAVLNNIEKAEFLCGKAEDVMESVIKRFPAEQQASSVAILDPPRSGLHTKVLSALRDSSLQRIVYISCNPKTLAEDAQRLCGPPSKTYPGQPFIPIAALGVDLFPHTAHCEAVMLLERRPPGSTQHILEFREGSVDAAAVAATESPVATSAPQDV